MLNALLAFLALAWPLTAAWLVLRLFPASLMKFVEKEIDRQSDTKLERIKAELQGSYSTLKTSVDVLTATNSGMHPHVINAVAALWWNMVSMRDKFGTMIAFDSIFLADEAQVAFSQGKNPQILEYVRPFEGEVHTNNLLIEFNGNELDKHRLFCGDRLWLIFYIYRAINLRNAFLMSESFKKREYRDWREDKGMEQLLGSAISNDKVAKLRESRFGGLADALEQLEGQFLHEATRVMSGSKAIADSLGDMQAMLLLQNAKVAESGSAKKL